MGFGDLLLGWLILTGLGIGSIVAAEPFWGARRPGVRGVLVRLEDARSHRDAPDDGEEDRRRAA